MGKRELLIIAAFLMAGLLAYQVANPTPLGRRPGFSLSNLVSSVRREVRGNPATATVTKKGTVKVPAAVSELRLSNVSRVSVTGGSSQDIDYELTVEANGPDEATAQQNADGAGLTEDVVGGVLSLRPASVPNSRQARLTLTIPARLSLRVTGGSGNARLDASQIAAVHLDSVVGDVRLVDIKIGVTGTHRNGEMVVSKAGSVALTLVSSKAALDTISGAITISARNGRSRIEDAHGPIELDVTNQEVTLVRPAGAVRVGGSGGRIAIEDPLKPATVDMRRTTVEIRLARAVPLTVLTADAPIRLTLDGSPAIALDAMTLDGSIDARDFSLVAEKHDEESRLRHTFGSSAAPVALRNSHAEIVISRTK